MNNIQNENHHANYILFYQKDLSYRKISHIRDNSYCWAFLQFTGFYKSKTNKNNYKMRVAIQHGSLRALVNLPSWTTASIISYKPFHRPTKICRILSVIINFTVGLYAYPWKHDKKIWSIPGNKVILYKKLVFGKIFERFQSHCHYYFSKIYHDIAFISLHLC